MKKIIVCKSCGQECERVSNAQKYCEKCAPTRYALQHKEVDK